MSDFDFLEFKIHPALRNHSSRLVGKGVWCYDEHFAKFELRAVPSIQ